MIDFEARADAREQEARQREWLRLAAEVRAGRFTLEQAAAQAGTTAWNFRASVMGQLPPGHVVAPGAAPPSSVPSGQAAPGPLGATPPAPGASYAGASADGRVIRWAMPDGSIVYTNVAGTTQVAPSQPGMLPPAAARPGAAPAGLGTQPVAPSGPPARTAEARSGVTIGEDEDYRAALKQVLASLGITEATGERLGFFADSEIDRLALSKADMNGIRDLYANHEAVIQINPGAPFGMSKQQYEQSVGGLQAAEQGVFGKQVSDFSRLPRERGQREGTTAGLALRERISPERYGQELERFRQERGTVPTRQEFEERRARPQYQAPGVPLEAPRRQDEELMRPALLPSAQKAISVRPAVGRR